VKKSIRGRIHSPGLVRRLLEKLRGFEQTLVRGPADWPLLLLSYPTGYSEIAEEVRQAWLHTFPALTAPAASPYRAMLRRLPAVVVVLLRPRNVCTCLGHHHPKGAWSSLTRRLAHDMGSETGEIDLAWEAIRDWRPHPLSSLAAGPSFEILHFRAALLSVLLHELEHLAWPDHQEREVRQSSDTFYAAALTEMLQQEGVASYGMGSGI
jgi:hypothetical protein